MYGCETWSLILREERRLWVFENRVLRRIFGAKRDEVTGEWRKLHNEELSDLYCSPKSVIWVIKSRMSGPGRSVGIATELQVGRSGDRILVGRRFFARPDRPWGPPRLL